MPSFDVLDQLHLAIENDPPAHPNLLPNPISTPEHPGAWGWLTPTPYDTLWGGFQYAGAYAPAGSSPPEPVGSPMYFTSEFAPVEAGKYVSGYINIQGLFACWYSLYIEWRNADGQFLAKTAGTATSQAVQAWNFGPYQAPAGTAFAALRVECYANSDRTMTPMTGTPVLQWDKAGLYSGATAAEVTNLGYVPPPGFTDILSPTCHIDISREPLNVGSITATILSASLDPATASIIRPGKKVRCYTHGTDGLYSRATALFTGEVSPETRVAYELKDPETPAEKRVRISLVVQDANADLAQVSRPYGYYATPGTSNELAAITHALEGAGVPWNVNGQKDLSAYDDIGRIPVSFNENASVLDQLVLTRDSFGAYAWLNALGILHVDSSPQAGIPGYTVIELDESRYSDFDLSFNTGDCINEVSIDYLRHNPNTGQTETVKYGPYRDEASRREWGPHGATFTVHGIPEDDLPAFAQAILDKNSTPLLRVNSVTVPIRTLADVSNAGAMALANADLYQTCRLVNATKGIDQTSYITSVKHTIKAGEWIMVLGFTPTSFAAAPSKIPAPLGGSADKTLGQLLRPVGEVTMFYGLPSQIPDGWLPLDGSTFAAAEYPDLYAFLGNSNVLPNMVDRLPIGAGSKALGTSGGSSTKTLGVANMPAHTHSIDHDHGVAGTNNFIKWVGTGGNLAAPGGGTSLLGQALDINALDGISGSAGSGTAFDIMPPWRALYFIIRAR